MCWCWRATSFRCSRWRRSERAFGWFCARFRHVVFVPGNHEYYRTSPAEADALLAACAEALPNLHVLNPGLAVIDGTRFVGGTMWFPATRGRAALPRVPDRLLADS